MSSVSSSMGSTLTFSQSTSDRTRCSAAAAWQGLLLVLESPQAPATLHHCATRCRLPPLRNRGETAPPPALNTTPAQEAGNWHDSSIPSRGCPCILVVPRVSTNTTDPFGWQAVAINRYVHSFSCPFSPNTPLLASLFPSCVVV